MMGSNLGALPVDLFILIYCFRVSNIYMHTRYISNFGVHIQLKHVFMLIHISRMSWLILLAIRSTLLVFTLHLLL